MVDLNIFQDGGDPDEAVLQGEPGGEDRIPEGWRRRHQETPLVPGDLGVLLAPTRFLA